MVDLNWPCLGPDLSLMVLKPTQRNHQCSGICLSWLVNVEMAAPVVVHWTQSVSINVAPLGCMPDFRNHPIFCKTNVSLDVRGNSRITPILEEGVNRFSTEAIIENTTDISNQVARVVERKCISLRRHAVDRAHTTFLSKLCLQLPEGEIFGNVPDARFPQQPQHNLHEAC